MLNLRHIVVKPQSVNCTKTAGMDCLLMKLGSRQKEVTIKDLLRSFVFNKCVHCCCNVKTAASNIDYVFQSRLSLVSLFEAAPQGIDSPLGSSTQSNCCRIQARLRCRTSPQRRPVTFDKLTGDAGGFSLQPLASVCDGLKLTFLKRPSATKEPHTHRSSRVTSSMLVELVRTNPAEAVLPQVIRSWVSICSTQYIRTSLLHRTASSSY